MLSYKHLILSFSLLATVASADVVHYDKKEVKPTSMTKPNHPGFSR